MRRLYIVGSQLHVNVLLKNFARFISRAVKVLMYGSSVRLKFDPVLRCTDFSKVTRPHVLLGREHIKYTRPQLLVRDVRQVNQIAPVFGKGRGGLLRKRTHVRWGEGAVRSPSSVARPLRRRLVPMLAPPWGRGQPWQGPFG